MIVIEIMAIYSTWKVRRWHSPYILLCGSFTKLPFGIGKPSILTLYYTYIVYIPCRSSISWSNWKLPDGRIQFFYGRLLSGPVWPDCRNEETYIRKDDFPHVLRGNASNNCWCSLLMGTLARKSVQIKPMVPRVKTGISPPGLCTYNFLKRTPWQCLGWFVWEKQVWSLLCKKGIWTRELYDCQCE